MAGPSPITYMAQPTISGLNGNLPPRPGTRWVQASSSLLTFFLLICLSEEYCIESMDPPKSLHVAYGCFGAADCPKPATRPANSVKLPASPSQRVEVCRAFLFIDFPLLVDTGFLLRYRRLTVCSIFSR